MKKLYVIRTQDLFNAIATNQLPIDPQFSHIGTIWTDVFLTDEERNNYKFPIDNYS